MFTVTPTIISPEEQEPLSYVLRDNFIAFTPTQTSFRYAQLANYEINTDTNLLPSASEEIVCGVLLNKEE